jgi:hypothetical protein
MPEFLLDHTPEMSQYVRPDEDGFTIRTRFHGEHQILDEVAAIRNAAKRPSIKGQHGEEMRFVGRLPMRVIHEFYMKHQRDPTPQECINMLRQREFAKLRGTEEKF